MKVKMEGWEVSVDMNLGDWIGVSIILALIKGESAVVVLEAAMRLLDLVNG
jgi:hypothetical protein